MLCVVEEKYGILFEYISYDGGWILDDCETLMAYSSTGDTDYDSFSVTRELENGEYFYDDDYANRVTDPILEKFVQNYCEERLGEENVKVYSIVFTIKTEKFPISIENVKGNIDDYLSEDYYTRREDVNL